MGTLLLLLITVSTCLVSLVRPWIGVLAYYMLAIWSPQDIWFWIFDGSRISLLVAVATLAGLALEIVKGKVDFKRIKNSQTWMLLLLLFIVYLSDFVSSYQGPGVSQMPVTPALVMSILTKSIIFYLVTVLLIDDVRKLRWLAGVIVLTGGYYTLWANGTYLSDDYWSHTFNGRLLGPSGSIYGDENKFSVMFIMCMPFIYFLGASLNSKLAKYSLWLLIPLLWHALFLIGSRGALLALGVSTLVLAFNSGSKLISNGMIVGLILAVVFQGGTLWSRATETLDTAQSGAEEEPLDPRLISWAAGVKMILDKPVLGVGTERFLLASPYYTDFKPHVAHNTFLQFASNCGLLAGYIYLWFFWRTHKIHKRIRESNNVQLKLMCHAAYTSLVGFFVCAIFLNLMISQFLYLSLAVMIVCWNILEQQGEEGEPEPDKQQRKANKSQRRISQMREQFNV